VVGSCRTNKLDQIQSDQNSFIAISLKPLFTLAAPLLVLATICCGPKVDLNKQGESRISAMTIENALKRHTDSLMSIPGVVGTAISQCDGRPCIMVLVVKKNAELIQKIPRQLEGFPVVVEETGSIRPLEKKSAKPAKPSG
jgi:hypothetical protein